MARTPRVRTIGSVAAIALFGVIGAATLGRASPAPSLPQIEPDVLIASVLRAMAAGHPISGHISAHIDIGLPSLPNIGRPNEASDLISAFTGDHRLRVWSSADGYRVSDLLQLGERSLFVSRNDVWAWDSGSYTAFHLGPFPSQTPDPTEQPPALGDPLALARLSLAAIDPTTSVAVARTDRVAGRPAYVLSVVPKTSATLVGRIEISIDAAVRLPLRVAIFAKGARSAAVSAGFTSVSFGPIDPGVYLFSPPEGAKIEQPHANASSASSGEPGEYVRVFGRGWTTVFAVRTPLIASFDPGPGGLDIASLLPFSGTLFSIRSVDRGDHSWVVYGAVPQAALDSVAPELP
jgi:outer membrane lipoprotein-sorting protein